MKKQWYVWLLMVVFTISCKKEDYKGMLVTGTIKGLKKGTLYLLIQKDSTLVAVDSIALKGNDQYRLKTFVKSPRIYVLSLDKDIEKSIRFFGENKHITINSTLKMFALKKKIQGSENQKNLEKYEKVLANMNFQRLKYIKASIEARKAKNFNKVDSIQINMDNLYKRRILYGINFAMHHRDSEVVPYIVLNNLQEITIKYLDSINNNLTERVRQSFYGKALQKFIKKRKDLGR